jgi:hypothetical protein
MTSIQPEFLVLKKKTPLHTQTHTHIFTDPIFVNRQLSMKPVNINIRQHSHTHACKSQETTDTSETHHTNAENATQ